MAEGGTIAGEPFEEVLKFRVSIDSPGFHMINVLSTLVAEYWETAPSLSYSQVQEDIHWFLDLPSYMTLEEIMQNCNSVYDYFDPRLFVMEANQVGYDAFFDLLLNEIDARQKHPFLSLGLGTTCTSILSGISGYLIDGLVAGLLQGDLAKKCYGGNYDGLFLQMLLTGGDAKGVQLDYIVDKLTEMDAKLDTIIGMLDDIKAAVNDACARLEIKIEMVKHHMILVEEERHIAGPIEDICDAVTTTEFLGKYKGYFNPATRKLQELDPQQKKTFKVTLEEDCNSFLGGGNDDVYKRMLAIKNAVLNPSGARNLTILQAITDVILDKILLTADWDRVNDGYLVLEAKFLNYTYWQLQGWKVFAEAYHVLHPDKIEPWVEIRIEEFRESLEMQTNAFLQQAERIVLNATFDTLEKEFPNGGTERILARARFIANLITGCNGSLTARVASRPDDSAPRLSFRGEKQTYEKEKEDFHTDLYGFRYMMWELGDHCYTVKTDNMYKLLTYNWTEDVVPGTYTEENTKSAVEIKLYDQKFKPIAESELNHVFARSVSMNPWGTYLRVDAGGGGYFLKAKDKDLWMTASNEKIFFSSDENEKTAVYFEEYETDAPKEPTQENVKVRVDGCGYIVIGDDKKAVTCENQASATKLQLVHIGESSEQGSRTGQNEIALRQEIISGKDDDSQEKTSSSVAYFYLYPKLGYPYGFWGHSLIEEDNGYSKSLTDVNCWRKGEYKEDIGYGINVDPKYYLWHMPREPFEPATISVKTTIAGQFKGAHYESYTWLCHLQGSVYLHIKLPVWYQSEMPDKTVVPFVLQFDWGGYVTTDLGYKDISWGDFKATTLEDPIFYEPEQEKKHTVKGSGHKEFNYKEKDKYIEHEYRLFDARVCSWLGGPKKTESASYTGPDVPKNLYRSTIGFKCNKFDVRIVTRRE